MHAAREVPGAPAHVCARCRWKIVRFTVNSIYGPSAPRHANVPLAYLLETHTPIQFFASTLAGNDARVQ